MPIITNVGCPACLSKGRDRTLNHLMVFENGSARCIKDDCDYVEPKGSRDKYGEPTDETEEVIEEKTFQRRGPAMRKMTPEEVAAEMSRIGSLKSLAIRERRLKPEYLSIFDIKVQVNESTGQPSKYFFPRHKDGKLVGYKVRPADDKKFFAIGDSKECDIFGQHLDGGRKLLILTEGEFDAVAVAQALGSNKPEPISWRVASLPNGANTTFSETTYKWLESFETIKCAFDMDDEGDKTADEMATMFPGKVERVILPCKDANDCLVEGKAGEIVSALRNSRKVEVGGIISALSAGSSIIDSFLSEASMGLTYPDFLSPLNDVTVGMQTGRMDIIGSGVGQGKTSLLRELAYHNTQVHGRKVAMCSLEETTEETMIGQLSLEDNRPLHHPKVRETLTPEYLQELSNKVFADDKFFIMDHASEMGIGDLYSKIKFMKTAYGVEYFFLDPLGPLVKGIDTKETDTNGQIESVMRNLAALTKQLDVYICIVSHGRKASSGMNGKTFERGGIMDLDDLMGSSAIKTYAHTVLIMARDQQAADPVMRSTVMLSVQKNRPMSVTGPQLTYAYDLETGRNVPSPIDCKQWAEDIGKEGQAPSMRRKK